MSVRIKTKTKLNKILGWFYRRFKIRQEKNRIWSFQRVKDFKSTSIIKEILYYSKATLVYLFFLLTLSVVLDSLFMREIDYLRGFRFITDNLMLPSKELVRLAMEIVITAISALLGIIFALYAVSFQISTDKYSETVTKFINRERVGNFYFRLLIFTVIFAVLVFLKLELTPVVPFVSASVVLFLAITSILGVIIFKDHYMLSLNPVSLFSRIAGEIAEFCQHAQLNRSRFAKSYNIVQDSRNRASKLIDVGNALYKDLIRNKNLEDASFGPLFLGEILVNYLKIKRYLDRERAWWFPNRPERVSSKDMNMYSLKANYEMKGIAQFAIPKTDYNWFENKILNLLNRIRKELVESDTILFSSVIDAYKTILTGEFKKQTEGYRKLTLGAFENQEFHVFDNALKDFIELYEQLPDDDTLFAEYTNTLGDIKTVIVDGFDYRSYPGVLIPWMERIQPWIKRLINSENHLGVQKGEIFNSDLPTYFREVLIDYWERLEIEDVVEGYVVTPKDWLETEIINLIKEKETELVEKYLLQIANHTLTIIKKESKRNYERVSGVLNLNYFTLNQLLMQERWDIAEKFTEVTKTAPFYISYLTKKQIEEIELREPIEKALFISLVNRKKTLLDFCLRSMLISLIVLRDGNDDFDSLIKQMRIPLMIGGLAYLISELDQDFYYVSLVAEHLDGRFYRPSYAVQLIEAAWDAGNDLGIGESYRLILEEANRYRQFYRYILNELESLPEDWTTDSGFFGGSKTVKHPSAFIRKIAAWEFSDMKECEEGFVEWMKKREEVKKLVNIINRIANEYQKGS